MHACALADGDHLLAGHAIVQLGRPRSARLFGGGFQHLPPLFVSTSCLPFGDGTVGLPGNHLIDADLRGHIDRLLVMAGFGESLHQREPGDRLRAPCRNRSTSAIPCCASRSTAWMRNPLPSESCSSSPSFNRMAWMACLRTDEGSVSLHPALSSSLFTGTSSWSVSSRKRASVIASEPIRNPT